MSRDRLAAIRAQNAPQYSSNPAPPMRQATYDDYDSTGSSGYGRQPARQGSYDSQPSGYNGGGGGLPSGPRRGGGGPPPRRQDAYGSSAGGGGGGGGYSRAQEPDYPPRGGGGGGGGYSRAQEPDYPPPAAQPRPSYSSAGSRRPNPFAQQDDAPRYGGGQQYEEMSEKAPSYPPSVAGTGGGGNPFASVASGLDRGGGGGGGMEAFFDRIANLQESLRSLQSTISTLSNLHGRLRSLPSTDSPQHATLSSQLSAAQDESRKLSNSLKGEINRLTSETKSLAATPGAITQSDVDLRLSQISNIQRRFVDLIQQYASVEKESRDTSRRKLERQVKIVNPSYSDQEVRAAADDIAQGNGDVFQQAMVGGQRLAGARGALSEVQRRQEEIQQIERTITELAQLFSDMAVLVEEQDVKIVAIEKNAEVAAVDIEQANVQLGQAKVSAKKARKKRIICFIILIIILAVAGVVIAVEVFHVGQPKSSSSSGSSSSNSGNNNAVVGVSNFALPAGPTSGGGGGVD